MTLTTIPGLKVGHWTDLEAATGCTVILCPEGAVAGVDVRGTAPGTRETDLLHPVCRVEKIHAILLGGGSAYGLAAADGVMQWLEEQNYGLEVQIARVPIVPAAILFDLGLGRADIRPTAASGYAACQAATVEPVLMGNVGAGTGATAGKLLGFAQATKTGLGSASREVVHGLWVAALVALNPVGDIYDPQSQQIIAGARHLDNQFADSLQVMVKAAANPPDLIGQNTTLAVIATTAKLSKSEATKVAQMAQDGLARTTRPAHTHWDGDTIFALSYGDKTGYDLSLIGAMAAEVLAEAVLQATWQAEPLHGLPSAKTLKN